MHSMLFWHVYSFVLHLIPGTSVVLVISSITSSKVVGTKVVPAFVKKLVIVGVWSVVELYLLGDITSSSLTDTGIAVAGEVIILGMNIGWVVVGGGVVTNGEMYVVPSSYSTPRKKKRLKVCVE